MRLPLTIVTALSGLAAAGLLWPSILPRYAQPPFLPPLRLILPMTTGDPLTKSRSDRSINLSYHPIVSGSVSVYSLNVTATSTKTATPSRGRFQAPFSIQRRTLNVTASPTITNIVMPINNLAVASEFNLFFLVMSPNSACDPKINTQAIVCINDQIATCGNDEKYKLQACPNGQRCRAVALDAGQLGFSIQCVPNDGAKIAQLTSPSATPTASASLIETGKSPRQGSGSIKISTTETAAPSLSGNKLNNIAKTSLHTSASTPQVVVESSHAPSTATRLFATVSSPTTSSAEISSKSEAPILRIVPVTVGENAAQSR